ncbi:hypothetical protein [Aurantimonas coralicida]|uniref:hypothetical protein n=1 Tax=Aurantimonas coralicida TaxID=182270 RepID=UPI001E32DA74|nr:hypothetical protein [Aurantimonas coralicida]MCD1641888.1 hypothetical protein [Aurantimonas coralicida]
MSDFLSFRSWVIFFGVESILAGVLWMIGLISPAVLILLGLGLLLGLWVYENRAEWWLSKRRESRSDLDRSRSLGGACRLEHSLSHRSSVTDFEGMIPSDREDFDLVPLRFILRGKRSDDGIDLLAIIQFRNRSRKYVAIRPLPEGAIFKLDDKDAENKSSGISTPVSPETSAMIRFAPIRIYEETDPVGVARLSIMFGQSNESMRTLRDMHYIFKVRSYPENKSVDAVLDVDIIEYKTKYYVKLE